MNTEKISQQYSSFDEASDLLHFIEDQKALWYNINIITLL